MKGNWKIFLLLSMIFVGNISCKKILNPDYDSSFGTDYIFSTESDTRKSVNMIYASFNQDAFTSRLSLYFVGNTDVEAGGVPATAAPQNNRYDIWSLEATDGNSEILTVWNNAYLAINRANICIKGIKNSALYKSGNTNVKQMLGEALALRAYWYYQLVNYWGDVPFRTEPSDASQDLFLERVDRNIILSTVIQDLIDIEPDMKWASQLDYGIEQVNRDFVLGLIARIALTRGGYSLQPDMTMKRPDDYLDYYKIANQYSKKLVQLNPHTLDNYSQVFLNECQYVKTVNKDVLYEVAYPSGFGDVAWCLGVRVDAGEHSYGSGSSYLCLPASYYHSFDTLDVRLPVTCSIIYYDSKLVQTPTGPTSIAVNKWSRLRVPSPLGSASAKGTAINWPLMRYSDVLLMLAETENELSNGPTAEAKDALAKVRARAFPATVYAEKVTNYIASVSGSKESFFNAIVNERAWEFGGERIRNFDLIRWNLWAKKIIETKNKLNEIGKDGMTPSLGYPDYLYYKKNSDGTITFLNKYSYVNAPPVVDVPNKGDNPNGYYRISWARSLYSSVNAGNVADYTLRNWRGYKDDTGNTPVRYILPLHQTTVTSSNSTINNNGYGYNQ